MVRRARERERVTLPHYNPRALSEDGARRAPEAPVNLGSGLTATERRRLDDWQWTDELRADYLDRAQTWLLEHGSLTAATRSGPGPCLDCHADRGVSPLHRHTWRIGRHNFCREHARLRRNAWRAAA